MHTVSVKAQTPEVQAAIERYQRRKHWWRDRWEVTPFDIERIERAAAKRERKAARKTSA